MSSLTKVLAYTSKIAITCISTLLIACEPLIFGGISGLGGSSSFAVSQCASGPADQSGACRSTPFTMGALEAIDSQVASAAAINTLATTTQDAGASKLNISWSTNQETALSNFVYYGQTSVSATYLESDLSISAMNIDTAAPAVSYRATLDLGRNTGDTVYSRIFAYDAARVPYTWLEVQCTVV